MMSIHQIHWFEVFCHGQVNGAINSKGELLGIGITTAHFWVLVNTKIGVDFEWNPAVVKVGQLGDWGLDIDMEKLVVTIQSQNAATIIHLTSARSVYLQVNIINR